MNPPSIRDRDYIAKIQRWNESSTDPIHSDAEGIVLALECMGLRFSMTDEEHNQILRLMAETTQQ